MTSRDYEAQSEATWAAACRMKRFCQYELAAEAKINVRRAAALIKGWIRAGLAVDVGKGERRRTYYQLTAKARPETLPANLIMPPKAPSTEEVMWRTIRMQRSFSPRDVAALSTTPEVTVTEEEAHRYLQVLLRGGYLRVVKPAKVIRVKGVILREVAIYRLVKNTGPIPPTERRVTGVWDGNSASFAHLPGGDA